MSGSSAARTKVKVALLISFSLVYWQSSAADTDLRREIKAGHDLFVGKAPLHGRIRTDFSNLPTEVVRCKNCHAQGAGKDVALSLAPRLNRQFLLEPRARRGGPMTSYDEQTFCRVLQGGLDPAYILVSAEMPRYEIDEGMCKALWKYITRTTDESAD
jgi:hypothetical protein